MILNSLFSLPIFYFVGGMTGMTHDDNFLEKWTLTSHLRGTVTTNLKLLCKMDDNMLLPKDFTNSSMRKSQHLF